jgi:hypothetical protein
VSTVVVSADPLSFAPSSYSDMKTKVSMGQYYDDHEPVYGGGIQMEYSPDELCNPSIGAATKKLPVIKLNKNQLDAHLF